MRWWWILGLAAVVRIVWIAVAARAPALQAATDPNVYRSIAERTARGDAYFRSPPWPFGHDGPTSYLSVLYPFVIGLVGRVVGASRVYPVAVGVNLMAGVALVDQTMRLVTSYTGRAVRGWRRHERATGAVLCAGLVTALYPDLVFATNLMMTEVVGALAVVMALRFLDEHRWIALGISTALLLWLRPGLPFVGLALLAMLWRRSGWRTAVRSATLCAVLVAPLAYHSTFRVGAAGLTSSTWINICDGSSPGAGGAYREGERCRDGSERSEREWSGSARRAALDQIEDQSMRYAGLVPARLFETFRRQGWGVELQVGWSAAWPHGDETFQLARRLADVAYYALLIAAAAGVWRHRRHRAVGAGALIAATSVLGVALAFGQTRYAVTTVVTLLIPATSMLAGGSPRYRSAGE